MDIYNNDGYIVDPRFPDNKIHTTAVIGDNVKIGKHNIILPYAVIGQAGFIRKGSKPKGTVEIGDSNSIGCYTNIMAGATGKTFIGNNNLLMNHSNIGHNVFIEDDSEIGAGAILNGFSVIGSNVLIKSGAIIRNRIIVGDDILIGQGSNVVKNISAPGVYLGNPARLKVLDSLDIKPNKLSYKYSRKRDQKNQLFFILILLASALATFFLL